MSLINTQVQPFKTQAFHNGKFIEVTEESLKGKWSVLIFMPAAFTFNCPTEVEDAADNYAEFQKLGAEVYIVTPGERDGDELLRDAIVYLTCVHETGHALGLAHTAEFADIMYSFQYGGDIDEYFGRYRRMLSVRSDIRKHSGMSDADRRRLAKLFATGSRK